MRDATLTRRLAPFRQKYFNPRIPCGMRLEAMLEAGNGHQISIHASHAGCDIDFHEFGRLFHKISIHASHAGCDLSGTLLVAVMGLIFQSTHPMRDATRQPCRVPPSRYPISIHASHAGCDLLKKRLGPQSRYFNPRIPCGMRLWVGQVGRSSIIFQSTHPMRDATIAL